MDIIYKKILMRCGVDLDRYIIIVSVICNYYNIEEKEVEIFLSKKENRYLYLLLMKEFKCFYIDKLVTDLSLKSSKCVMYNLRRAEEKLLINKEFREDYFYIEEKIQKKF